MSEILLSATEDTSLCSDMYILINKMLNSTIQVIIFNKTNRGGADGDTFDSNIIFTLLVL